MPVLGDLEGVDRHRLQRVLESKHARMCAARRVARELEEEYLELLDVAAQTGAHGEWARLRRGVYDATREVLKPRSMFARAKDLASYPVPPRAAEEG